MNGQTNTMVTMENRIDLDLKSVFSQIQEALSQNKSLIDIEISKPEQEQKSIFCVIYMFEETEEYAKKIGIYFEFTGKQQNGKKEFKVNLLNTKSESDYEIVKNRADNVDYRKILNDDLNEVLSKLRKELVVKANQIENVLKGYALENVTSKIYMYEENEKYCVQYGFILNFTGNIVNGKKEIEVDLVKAQERTCAQEFLKPHKSYSNLY